MDDLISRKVAIAYACSGLIRRMDDGDWKRVEEIRRDLKEMPSAQPFTDEEIQKMQDLEFAEIEKAYETGLREGRKKGEWIELANTNHTYVCSVCGRMLVNITDGKNRVAKNYPFCHCGADMRGDKHEID